MAPYLLYLALHFTVCLAFFVILQKPVFFAYNRVMSTDPVADSDLRDIYRHGVATDLVAAAYLTALPWLVLTIGAFVRAFPVGPALVVTDIVVAVVAVLTVVADTALYRYWQFKIDASVFAYLRSLKGATASVSSWYIIGLVVLVAVLGVGLYALLMLAVRVSDIHALAPDLRGWHLAWDIMACLLAAAIIFACIRGVRHRPNTPCMTYYSPNMFLNHAALNPLYNLIYSFTVMDGDNRRFAFMDTDECNRRVADMFPTTGTPQTRLLNTDRPNILLIVWESLSARHVAALGGKPGVCTNFDRLCNEGVLFTRCEAGSFRTDRALVCILSGYLGQPTMSIIRNTTKLPGLPALPRTLRGAGYHTTALHGGDLKIMHKNDYYIVSGHDRVMGIECLPQDAPRCSWGVHDNFTFDYVTDMILDKTEADSPWFMTFQTLSSHEPYKVPDHLLDNQVDNTFAFTDAAFGRMIDRLKQSPAWQNLLVVVVGDHGLNCVDDVLPHHQYGHIPLLMVGGAVAEPRRIDTLMSQTDLAATLLGQLDINHDDFIFSRDVLADTYQYPFSLHSYNNGFVFRDASGCTDYDNNAARAVVGADADRELRGRMILQRLYGHIASL